MINDYELIYLAQENNEEARNILHQKYCNFIYSIVDKTYKKYKFITTDKDDLKLECILILDNAINNYNQDKEAKFSSYIKLCIETKLKDVIRTNLTKKAKFENNLLSLEEEIKDRQLKDLLYSNNSLIAENYIDLDDFVYNINKQLSNKEKEILVYLVKGKTQEEIALLLNIEVKSIRNTIFRLKTKLKEQLKKEGSING